MFIPIDAVYKYSADFDFGAYREVEQEMKMLFPEIGERRANFIQFGNSAILMAEVLDDDRSPVGHDETYYFTPCGDGLRSIRFKVLRHMSVDEFRMAIITAQRTSFLMLPLKKVIQSIAETIVGETLNVD